MKNEVITAGAPLDWMNQLWTAYREPGIIALSFWTASLFAEKIRDQHNSFPFLEMQGEPASGKSTLCRFLYALLGREHYEGINARAATDAALEKHFQNAFCRPVTFTFEGALKKNRPDRCWDDFRLLFNGLLDLPFGTISASQSSSCTLVFAHNDEVELSPSMRERTVRMTLRRAHFDANSKRAAERLDLWDFEQLQAFLAALLERPEDYLASFALCQQRHMSKLVEIGGCTRGAKNHAQIAAAVDTLCDMVGVVRAIRADIITYIYTMARFADHRSLTEAEPVYIGVDVSSRPDLSAQSHVYMCTRCAAEHHGVTPAKPDGWEVLAPSGAVLCRDCIAHFDANVRDNQAQVVPNLPQTCSDASVFLGPRPDGALGVAMFPAGFAPEGAPLTFAFDAERAEFLGRELIAHAWLLRNPGACQPEARP